MGERGTAMSGDPRKFDLDGNRGRGDLRIKGEIDPFGGKMRKDWQFVDKSANKIPKVIMHSKK